MGLLSPSLHFIAKVSVLVRTNDVEGAVYHTLPNDIVTMSDIQFLMHILDDFPSAILG